MGPRQAHFAELALLGKIVNCNLAFPESPTNDGTMQVDEIKLHRTSKQHHVCVRDKSQTSPNKRKKNTWPSRNVKTLTGRRTAEHLNVLHQRNIIGKPVGHERNR